MNDVVFERQASALDRQLPSQDGISGKLFYGVPLPQGFGTAKIKRLTCKEDAEQLGIAEGSVDYGVVHYQVSEFYRKNPGGILYLGLFPIPQVWNFDEIWQMKQFCHGSIRLYGVSVTKAFATTDVEAIQLVLDKLRAEHAPGSVFYTADFSGIQETGLADLHDLECQNVSVVLGQDGSGVGSSLAASTGKSVACIGAMLGVAASAQVHLCIAYVKRFRMDDIVELSVPCLANGDTLESLTMANIDDINNKGYLFLRTLDDTGKVYINDSHTATSLDSDYCKLENNRTMDKAEREIRKAILPELNGPLYVDGSSGKLDANTIAFFEAICNEPLENMKKAGELSGMAVTIDPNQNVLSSSELVINVGEVPVGVARRIRIKIGFKLKV